MSPTFYHVLGQIGIMIVLWIFWLLIGRGVFALMWSWLSPLFIRDDIVVIREKGFRLEGAIDLNPDRYEYPVTHSLNADSSLEIRNLTMHAVRISPLRSGDLTMPAFSLQQPDAKAPSPEAPASEITLAAGQSGWLTFEHGGDYDITVHHLDGAAFLYDHLIVHIWDATRMAVITEQGFLVTNTIADLHSVSYTRPAEHSILANEQVRFKNLTDQPVRLCLGNNGVCNPQAAGPEELCSGLTLAPGQSASVTFELGGDYDITTHRLDGAAFLYDHLIVQVWGMTPMAVITEQGFLVTDTIADLRSVSYTRPAKYSISSDEQQARFKNLTDQPVRLCLGNNGVCNPQAAGPQALRSGLTLAPGQSASVTFEFGGKYDITTHRLDGAAFLYDHLIIDVALRWTTVITEQGFLVTLTIDDLRSARYTLPTKYSTLADRQKRFKNLTDQPVRLCLGQNGVCNSQAAGPQALRSGLTLAPGQSAGVTFELDGDYDITTHRLDGAAFPFNHLIVQVWGTTPMAVITEQGFLVTDTIADVRSARYTRPARHFILADEQVRFKNLTDQPVRLCLGNNGICNPQAAGPQALRSGLTLAAGQSSWLTFELGGDYDITVHHLDGAAFLYDHLIVHIWDATPMAVITEQGFLVTDTIADLRSVSYTRPAKYSISSDEQQARFKNLTDQPVRLCLGNNGVCNPQAAGCAQG